MKINNQSGQGIIEYVLILVVTVALILGLVVQFNDSFRIFLNNYFGEYLACLLETGELPSAGAPQNEASSICAKLYAPFDPSSGRSALGEGGVGGGSSQGGGGDETNRSSGPRRSATVSNAQSRSGGSGGGDGVGRIGSFKAGNPSPGESGGGGGAGRDGGAYTGSLESSLPSWAGSRRERVTRFKASDLDRSYGVTGGRRDKEGRPDRIAIAKKETSGSTEKKKSFKINRKPAQTGIDEADTSLTLGGFLRFLLIAAIIIAILIFFGGQVLQLSRSMGD